MQTNPDVERWLRTPLRRVGEHGKPEQTAARVEALDETKIHEDLKRIEKQVRQKIEGR